MELKQNIIGDTLTFGESQFEGEYIAKWRGLTVATVAKESEGLYAGHYSLTEWGADQESTSTPYHHETLDACWRHIKGYCRGDFDDELREINSQNRGFHL